MATFRPTGRGGLPVAGPLVAHPTAASASSTSFRILLNLFEVQRRQVNLATVWHTYDITIILTGAAETERGISYQRKMEVMKRLEEQRADLFQQVGVYDGQKLYFAPQELLLPGGGTFQFLVNMSALPPQPGGQSRGLFTLQLTWVACINLAQLFELVVPRGQEPVRLEDYSKEVMLLQMLVQSAPNQARAIRVAQSVFPTVENRAAREALGSVAKILKELGSGLIGRRGFFQSVRPVIHRVFVNVDTTTKAFIRDGWLYDVAADALGIRRADMQTWTRIHQDRTLWKRLQAFFKGILVTVDRGDARPVNGRLARARRIMELVPEAGCHVFSTREGEMMTVQNYYQRAYSKRINFPKGFGIRFGKDAVVPGELVRVAPGQLFRHKLSPDVMSKMLEFAVQKPQDKLNAITSAVQKGVLEWENSAALYMAGVGINTAPLEMTALRLPSPSVRYADVLRPKPQPPLPSVKKPTDGKWDVRDVPFCHSATINQWAFVNFTGRPLGDAMTKFAAALARTLQSRGVRVPPAPFEINAVVNVELVLRELPFVPNTSDTLLVAILPEVADEIRWALKHHTLSGPYAMATQCVKITKITGFKSNGQADQYCNNLALKINTKLGGYNGWVDDSALNNLRMVPTIVFGADVSHPGPGMTDRPSVASLVWSTNNKFTRYNSMSRVQHPRTEIIADMKTMVEDALTDFLTRTSASPQRLIFFRDGVSEGEFATVLHEECRAIDEGIQAFMDTKPPNIKVPDPQVTFIVVGKRHHVRMFPKDRVHGGNGNCPPGVVTTKEIKHPSWDDWYTVSQGGLLGTSVPAHYTVLRDDSKIPLKALQQISYALCYSYHRATRSVSIPAPVYYADLLCGHAPFQFKKELRYEDEASTATEDGRPFDLERWQHGFVDVDPSLRERFWYL